MRIDNAVASFPQLFTPTKVKGSDRARYGVQILIPPDHPQLNEVWQEFENVKNAGFPSGLPSRSTVCFDFYENQVDKNKDYYDPRFEGWWMLSAYSPGDKPRPAVVMENGNGALETVMDPAKPFSGELMHFHVNIYTFTEGNQGVACGLNGVCLTGEEGPMGRLDNRPTAEQMFGKPVVGPGPSRGTGGPPQQSRPPSPAGAPGGGGRAPAPPGSKRAPAPPAGKVMTTLAKSKGYTYESLKEAGWDDDQMIEHKLLVPPTATPSWN